jgi:hypothetical protein
LWPSIVRVSERLGVAKLAAVHSEHTPSGAHYSIVVDFPQWVPTEILRAAAMLRVDEVFALLPESFEPMIDLKSTRREPRFGMNRR